MKLFLNITLILLTVFACFIENIYLAFNPPEAGVTSSMTFRARHTFVFDQKEALSSKRVKALSQYVPIFNYTPERAGASKKKMQDLSRELLSHQARKKKRVNELIAYIYSELGVEVSPQTIYRVLRYRDLKKLLNGILTIEETILQNKILGDSKNLTGKKTIEIRNPALPAPVVSPVSDLFSLDTARQSLHQKVQQLFWQVDNRVLNPVLEISQATLLPNLVYDQNENARRLDKIHRQFPVQTLTFEPGEILIPFNKILSEQDVLLLSAYQKKHTREIYQNLAWIVLAVLFMVIFYNLFLTKVLTTGSPQPPPQRPLLSLLILATFVLKGCLLFTPVALFAVPFAFLPLMVISLNHGRLTATGTAVVGSILTSLYAGPQYSIVLYFIFGGLAAALASANIQQRWQIIIPSLIVGLVNGISVFAFRLNWQAVFTEGAKLAEIFSVIARESVSSAFMEQVGWAFAGGVAAGPIALLLLPLLEISWDTASTFKLNRYTDLQRPLMKKLLKEAPGTYQHSMTVAYLSQGVGEAIGANTLLLRIGAYYHDIGKMQKPKNFIENQTNNENPHDFMDPWESTELIINHVKQGMKIAIDSGLPRAVVDLIMQHHGSQLIEYFYSLAAKDQPRETIDEADFRYPGPKPQSVEAAILMIVDAAEAASRTMQNPNRIKLEKMVQLIVGKRIADGQFSQCDLTTREISQIVDALVKALEVSFHARIRYPWQENVAVKKKSGGPFQNNCQYQYQ